MATYKEQLERYQQHNQAKKDLTFELLRDPDGERVVELKNEVSFNDPNNRVRFSPRTSWALKRHMPWMK